MAIPFNKIKSTVLNFTDIIQTGKLQGCRVCDVIDDEYEYLIWADKSKLLQFRPQVIEKIMKVAHFIDEERHYKEEIEPYLKQDSRDNILALADDVSRGSYGLDMEDVPF